LKPSDATIDGAKYPNALREFVMRKYAMAKSQKKGSMTVCLATLLSQCLSFMEGA
jgi:hypothetical protein